MARQPPQESSALLVAAGTGAVAAEPGNTSQPAFDASAGALPRLQVSANYVAGISSGGYMATQLQVVHSSRFSGAGIYSAGPYHCAEGSLAIALADCLPDTTPSRLAGSWYGSRCGCRRPWRRRCSPGPGRRARA